MLYIIAVISMTLLMVYCATRNNLRLSSQATEVKPATKIDDECVVDHARGCVMLRNIHDGQFHVVRASRTLSVKLGTRQYVISKSGLLVVDKNDGIIYSTRFST